MITTLVKQLRHMCRCICICQCCTNIHEFDPEFHSHSVHHETPSSKATSRAVTPPPPLKLLPHPETTLYQATQHPSTKSHSSNDSDLSTKSTATINRKIDELESLLNKQYDHLSFNETLTFENILLCK